MSNLQPYGHNPIEQRKVAVRKYTRNAAVWTGGGVVVGAAAALMASSLFSALVLFIIIAGIGAVGGFVNWQKVQRIVNYKDPQ